MRRLGGVVMSTRVKPVGFVLQLIHTWKGVSATPTAFLSSPRSGPEVSPDVVDANHAQQF